MLFRSEGAKREAERLGYRVRVESCIEGEGSTDGVAERLVSNLVADLISKDANTDGLVSGGEPTVVLPDSAVRGRGGRNQHLVLSVAKSLASEPDCRALLQSLIEERASMVFVSGGTDGEDGASDAAGAWIDGEWIRANANRLDWMKDGLRRCDSNTLFRETGHTIETGATHTNVCDLRVLLYKLHG